MSKNSKNKLQNVPIDLGIIYLLWKATLKFIKSCFNISTAPAPFSAPPCKSLVINEMLYDVFY